MLISLSIRNIVIIDKLDLTFDHGLGVLTGETGAGKSILLDSLGFALGNRADARLLRPGAEQARVAAAFEVARDHPAPALRDEHRQSHTSGTSVSVRVACGGRLYHTKTTSK